MNGTLYIVATPIGNLNDISSRALQILTSVDFIVAEDTRRSKRLLDRFEISTRLVSSHQHSSQGKNNWIINELKSGSQVALVTDAGTPGICDPGGQIVEMAAAEDIAIIPISGPSALATILSVTGWENEPVLFLGYLPKKKGRQTLLGNIKELNRKIVQTIVFYESPERVIRTFNELANILNPECQLVVGRELTKQFEEITRLPLSEATTHNWSKKGEYVIALQLK
jgi:16S rRNA (cytidine1402-2'-O)-methyltransferase